MRVYEVREPMGATIRYEPTKVLADATARDAGEGATVHQIHFKSTPVGVARLLNAVAGGAEVAPAGRAALEEAGRGE